MSGVADDGRGRTHAQGLHLVRVLPRRAMSRAVGALAGAPVPRAVLTPLLALYAKAFGARLDEASAPLSSHRSFRSFFTRTLKEGARPLPEDPLAVASPSDGHVHTASVIEEGALLQAKGARYTLEALLGSADAALRLEGGSQITIHLAPGDYHRFHWPFDAEVDLVRWISGDLWPVHPRAAASIPGLFARNERVVLEGRTRSGAPFAIVAVGATNVGAIRLSFHPVRTNRGATAGVRTWRLDGDAFERGDEMGLFEMGSTLVVVLAPEAGRLDDLAPGTPLLARQAIGRLRD